VGGNRYTRYYFGQETGEKAKPFRFPPVENWEELRKQANETVMPAALTSGEAVTLVDVASIPGVKINNVYAGADNIFGAPLYTVDKLYLGSKAVEALAKVQERLATKGYGLVVWDAYRPWAVSKLAHLALPADRKFMLEDPDLKGSKHNTGNSVDVSLYDLETGEAIEMSSGFDEAFLMSGEREKGIGYPDYLKFLFSRELKQKPGSKFCYSNGDTYLLGRIVSKIYNCDFRNLCYEKIFLPLEIGYPDWTADPQGYCHAATGLQLNIENMNKLGILFLNKGVYKGKRIVSEKFVEIATKQSIVDPNSWWGNYGFQWWMVPEGNGYRADGMFGQITIVWPNHDAVLSFQRPDDERMDVVKRILDEEILSKIK
jgi:D-alanyl-D-alanine dipeptidase